MRITPDISSVIVILVGNFNPLIFRPDWFGKQELLSQAEVEAAEIEVIHSEISIFRTTWLSLRTDQQRLVAETMEPPFVRQHDLLVRTFKEFLNHTPLRMLGINRVVHFDVGSSAVRDAMGRALAPRDPWGEWGPQIDAGEGEKHGGMRSLVMEQRAVEDRPKGYIRAKIGPSSQLKSEDGGTFMAVNDHYALDNADASLSASAIAALLERNYERSIERSEWIVDQIMALSDAVKARL